MVNDMKTCEKKNQQSIRTPLKLKAKMFLTKTRPENASLDGIL